ncbi:MAG: hypothetical protein HY864_02200 [Chloroflexi bacterium]|nr:hypothetical protein [Chloroflexota bacterium]
MKTKLATFLLLLALLLVPTSNAYAQSPNGDVFLLGQNYTLESGETLDGSLAVIGGNVTIEEDSIVNGDVVLVGGNLSLDGKINGEVVLVGGNLTVTSKIKGNIVVVGGQVLLTETAVITGDVTTIGGQVEKEPGAEVGGNIVNNAPPIDIPEVPAVPNIPNVPDQPAINVNVNPFWEVANIFGRAIAIALIGMLLTLFLQPQLERVADAMSQQALMAGSFGLLTVVVAPLAVVIMVITLILIPVALIALLVLPLAWLFGMVALGQEIGERFTKAINQTWAPVLTTGLGTFTLVLIVGFVGMIPCFGWLLSFLITLIAIGGVTMTVFGTRTPPGKMATNPQVEIVPPAS